MNENNGFITIHFFKNNNNPDLNYQELVDFIEKEPHFTGYESEDSLEIEYKDEEFGLAYSYYITKKSHVEQIYRLDPTYVSAKFMLKFPVLISSFLAREILTLTIKITKKFDFGCYAIAFDDVRNCSLVDLLDLFEKERKLYMDEFELPDTFFYNGEKLGVISKFQRSIKELEEYYHNEVIVNKCYAIEQKDADSEEEKVEGICYDWRLGTPIIFPPYVDFILVMTDEDNYLVPKKALLETISKCILEIKNFLPDTYIVKEKAAKKSKKYLKKIAKLDHNFAYKKLELINVVEG